MFGKTSLGSTLLVVGSILTVVGFVAYFQDNPTLNLAGFFYGIPLLLGGLALRAAELQPVPYSEPVSPEVLKLREEQATPTQNQVRKDVTRFRYGQEAHLDEALERLGLGGQEPPQLVGIRETEIGGAYALILEFDSKAVPVAVWQEKQVKFEKFFGPNVRAEIRQPEENRIELALITLLEPALVQG
ncbi:MAG TPA: DUF2854 domain-containing protein [Trichocoleus sp.]